MNAREILSSSGVALARAIRERRLRSRVAVETHIERIRRVNPGVNAVVKDRFADALREADAADAAVAEGRALPPLHGVPCTVKEAFAFRGMPHTSGLHARRDVVADADAVAVARLRAAGAIPLGVTNVSELCMWMESSNKVWGRTNNAYDAARTAGGSSGGEGAIVGAGGSPFGLGSDVGGSIRMPAFFNGVFGHKPTGGLVPHAGHYPVPRGDVQRYNTVGPLARRAEDLEPVLRLLAGDDAPFVLGDPASVDLRKLTVYTIESNGAFAVDDALVRAQRRAADALASRGAKIETRALPRLKYSLEIWSTLLNEGGGGESSFREMMGAGEPFRPLLELARFPFGSRYTLPGLLLSVIEPLPALMPARAKKTLALAAELARELEEMLGDDGVMLFPSYPEIAPRHHRPLLIPFKWVYTAIFNVLELPVTQVPLGLDARALPLGCQVVASKRGDHRTIAVALALESALGGWTSPPRFD